MGSVSASLCNQAHQHSGDVKKERQTCSKLRKRKHQQWDKRNIPISCHLSPQRHSSSGNHSKKPFKSTTVLSDDQYKTTDQTLDKKIIGRKCREEILEERNQ
jgi:hypothetical protein